MDSKNTRIQPKQGEIWLFDPDPIKGNELEKKVRPCLVISHNSWNKISTGLVIIVPLTSVNKEISTHIRVTPPDGGLSVESFALCEQVRSISRERLVKRTGVVSHKVLVEVHAWICDLINVDFG
jgi:mRNA interferase MazF